MTFTVRIKTLTPLWTGGLDGTMDRIHETGILGSLRWWYEAIVRGLGGSACDPTGDERCPDKNGHYCDVCQVFGATGLQRAFRLEGPEWWNKLRGRSLTVRVKNNKGWFLRHGYLGEDKMQIIPLRLPEGWSLEDLTHSLYLIMKLIECWGGLGPKTQVGYGVVRFNCEKKNEENNKIELNIEQAIKAIQNLQKRNKRRNITGNQWPTLDEFFFVKVRFLISNQDIQTWLKKWKQKIKVTFESSSELDWYLNYSVVPLSPIIRYYLRGFVHSHLTESKEVRHKFMGTLRQRSLIHISHAYPIGTSSQWEFRIWGWVPDSLPGGVTRDAVLDRLHQWLGVSQDVSQQGQWHLAQNGQLWQSLDLPDPKVCWFEKEPDEETADFLRRLLNTSECKKEAT